MQLYKKLGIAGGSLFSLGVLIGFIVFPPFLKSQIKKQMALKPGTDMRNMWEDFPLPLDFKIYMFNITNPDDIKNGGKPIVQEIGPFFYDEYKQKVDLEDRAEDDTVEYSNKITWVFNPSKSAPGLTENVEIFFPHPMILGIVMATVRDKPAMVGLAAKAIDSIFHKPDSVFIKTTPRQVLWEGLPVDCTVKDFAGSAVCSILLEDESAFIKEGPGQYRIALFGHKNGTTIPDRIRVKRGMKNIFDVGVVTEFKGQARMDVWDDEGDCNAYNGTDSTIFHPWLYEDEDVVSFAPDLCRSIGARFQKHSSVKGIPSNRYTASLGDMSKDPELKCLCPTADTCLKKGLFDLFNCVKAPIVASLPHLYEVDEEYLRQVDGLHPNAEEHEIFLEFEPFTGSPMSARKRLQFNMFIFPVEKFKLMKNFPTALLPLFWVEEGILLNDDFIGQLKAVFKLISMVGIMKWSMLVVGMGLGGGAGGLFYKVRQAQQKLDITKITPKTIQQAINGEKNVNVSTIHGSAIPPNLDA
uniref:Sensory neuron membrane protein 2 n=1 Tax=Aulacocentrum confusum TaxID=2767324 RepID=A0A7G8Z9J3_9HYME|nr:sensory neuron membrane protein 2 [Aulacocentrum confusum]